VLTIRITAAESKSTALEFVMRSDYAQLVTGIRERARVELTAEIKRLAREQIAAEGASALSLRAIARDLQMVSSAIYRYFASRDELLTALIMDSYDALGFAVAVADEGVKPTDHLGRWIAVCDAARRWALANPAEYGLIFGTPVPGYQAPADTIASASRYSAVLVGLLKSINESSERRGGGRPVSAAAKREYRLFRGRIETDLPDDLIVAGLSAWATLFGAISFEVFGHLRNVIDDRDAHFAAIMKRTGQELIEGR
jgi:AcrR family transcriptional regulator